LGKFAEISMLIRHYDVCCLQETWSNYSIEYPLKTTMCLDAIDWITKWVEDDYL